MRAATIDELVPQWQVVPVRGKAPMGRDWPSRAVPAGEADGLPPGADGWGLLLGPSSGVIDVECDSREAEAEYARLVGDDPPVCPTWKSPRGKHRLFAWDDRLARLPTVVKLPDGLEVRLGQDRAQSVLPPSGGRRWLVPPDDRHPPPLPERLLEAVLACAGDGTPPPPARRDGSPTPAAVRATLGGPNIRQGSRNRKLASLAGTMRRRGMTTEAIEAALLEENACRCDPPLPDDEVRAIARSISRYEPPEPIPIDPLPTWRPFPLAALPEPLRGFVARAADTMGCDPSYIALPLLATCAAAIGCSRCLQVRPDWCEPAVLWTAIVGESGTMKTPAINFAVKRLQQHQQREFKKYEEARKAYDNAMLRYDADLARWRRKQRMTNQDPPEKPAEPACVRYCVSDTTCEALAPILGANPRGVLLVRDELAGWLHGHNQYKRGRGDDTANWLSAWQAGPWTIDRKGSGTIHIPAAAVSITGASSPACCGPPLVISILRTVQRRGCC